MGPAIDLTTRGSSSQYAERSRRAAWAGYDARMRRELCGPYRFVFLDVGETLVRLEPPFDVVALEEAARLGAELDRAAMRRAAAEAYRAVATEAHIQRYSISSAHSLAFWGGMYRRLAQAFGITPADAFAARLYWRFTRFDAYAPVPGACDVLRRLNRMGLRVVAASNWEAWLTTLLEHLALDRFFHAEVISGWIGLEKPEPGFFLCGLDTVGAAAGEVVHVGDSFELDVQGAWGAGIDAVWLNPAGRSADECPTITALSELPGLLRGRVVTPQWRPLES